GGGGGADQRPGRMVDDGCLGPRRARPLADDAHVHVAAALAKLDQRGVHGFVQRATATFSRFHRNSSPTPLLFRPPGPAVLRHGLQAGRGSSRWTASTFGRHRLGRPSATGLPPSTSVWKKVPPTDHEVLLNNTHAVADEPVEPKPSRHLQREDS